MVKRTTHSHHAYSAIREQITSGQLSPGAVVSEAALAKQLGLSRTPVGEALRRLAHEGLVDQIPRYGTVVRSLSTEELRELFEIREALEGMAAAKAALNISLAAIEEMEVLCEAIDAEIQAARARGESALEGDALNRFLAADMSFHMHIIGAARNRRLSALLEQTRSISSMFHARRGVHSLERVIDANQWHRKILAALVDRDPDRASQLVVSHVQHSCSQSLLAPELSDAPVRFDLMSPQASLPGGVGSLRQ
ncbi:MAG: GntR family transcriptional regulator [Planctomycetales bacterium]|nr:GntR family transcriptional regulator [Planctomycetales bacterium]